jgi:hypothetical protein
LVYFFNVVNAVGAPEPWPLCVHMAPVAA